MYTLCVLLQKKRKKGVAIAQLQWQAFCNSGDNACLGGARYMEKGWAIFSINSMYTDQQQTQNLQAITDQPAYHHLISYPLYPFFFFFFFVGGGGVWGGGGGGGGSKYYCYIC